MPVKDATAKERMHLAIHFDEIDNDSYRNMIPVFC